MSYNWTSMLPQAPAPTQLNQWSDYYDPVKSTMNALVVAKTMDDMQDAKRRKKIEDMQLENLTNEQKEAIELYNRRLQTQTTGAPPGSANNLRSAPQAPANALASSGRAYDQSQYSLMPSQGGQPNQLAAAAHGSPQTTSSGGATPTTPQEAPLRSYGALMARQAQQEKQQARIDKMADLVHKLGPQGIAAMKPQLEQMDPMWKNIDPSKLGVQGGVIHYDGPKGGVDVYQTPDGHYRVRKAGGAQSDPGKRVADRTALVRQYGEGSPQVQQFDQQAGGAGKNQTKSRWEFGKNPLAGASGEGGPAGQNYTQEDLEFTAKKYGMTVDEVKQRLGVK